MNWRRLGVAGIKREEATHYPVPSNIKASKELPKTIEYFTKNLNFLKAMGSD